MHKIFAKIMMLFTHVPVAPLRAEANHRSEMVSQLLFGELAEILATNNDFYKVKMQYDGYEGWVQKSQMLVLKNSNATPVSYVTGREKEIVVKGKNLMIPMGAPIYNHNDLHFEITNYSIDYLYDANQLPIQDVALLGALYLGSSYLWGGKSPWGIDCSGLVQQVYKLMGIALPRDAWQQALVGETLDFLAEAKTGDLAFFDNAEGRITHVGIMLGNDRILHASGDVHVDDIDTHGITHHLTGKRTHQLRLIKRLKVV